MQQQQQVKDRMLVVTGTSSSSSANLPKKEGAKKNKNVDLDVALGYKMAPQVFEYNERDVILYALGVGACADPHEQREDLRFVYENHEDFAVLPTMGVVIPFAALGNVMNTPGLNFNPMMLLHGEQHLEIMKPIPSRAKLINHGRIGAIYDKGKGAVVAVDVDTLTPEGELVLRNRYTCFIRGLGGFGGDPGPRALDLSPPADRAPDLVVRERTQENQAVLYRLSGDWNPLHIDYSMAAMGGFKRPILHGLCSFGYACRAVLRHFADNDPARFRSVSVRFAAPVFPGESLVTEMWRVSPNEIRFQVKVAERGVYVLKNCQVTLNPAASSEPSSSSSSSSAGDKQEAQKPDMPQVEQVFQGMARLSSSPDLVKKIGASFRFDISSSKQPTRVRSWFADFKSSKADNGDRVKESAEPKSGKADCIIALAEEDFLALMSGKLDAQKAFLGGKIKLKGNMMLAQKLALLSPKPKKASRL